MEQMRPFVCRPEIGKLAKEAGLFGDSVWVWIPWGAYPRLMARKDCPKNVIESSAVPAVMLEEAIKGIGKIPGVQFSDDDFSDGFSAVGFMFKNIWYNYPSESSEAVELAIRIKEEQNG